MYFEVVGAISGIENIAVGGSIRDVERLRKRYGRGRWRKVRGFANVVLADGTYHRVELHFYEAHGIGRVETKIKRLLD